MFCYRFGREYYVREASKPKGARKVNGHTEDDSVSIEEDLQQLEENCVHSSLPRQLYSPRNSSKNFVQNPLLSLSKH